jgi:hypothetical protein
LQYGGGRTIRPGEPLISEEEKAARDQKTMALIDAYKKKMGIEMDANVKEKADKVGELFITSLRKYSQGTREQQAVLVCFSTAKEMFFVSFFGSLKCPCFEG